MHQIPGHKSDLQNHTFVKFRVFPRLRTVLSVHFSEVKDPFTSSLRDVFCNGPSTFMHMGYRSVLMKSSYQTQVRTTF